ncbi:hypothetical protein BGLA2_1340012 [Burkholderia gladioli]|nr:hypothetical protein BGLA2_1340012 [Burkholderia gladioli]
MFALYRFFFIVNFPDCLPSH